MTDERVAILNNTTREIEGYCYGPAGTGQCPQAAPERIVACAGRRIAAPNANPLYWLMPVPANCRQCPLAWDLESVGI